MAWLYVNPGYGSLFTPRVDNNDVGYFDAARGNIPVPNLKELYIKYTLSSDSSVNTFTALASNSSTSFDAASGVSVSGNDCSLQVNGQVVQTMTTKDFTWQDGVLLVHIKSDTTDGRIDVYLNNQVLFQYTGNVNNEQTFSCVQVGITKYNQYTSREFKNIIVSDMNIFGYKIVTINLSNTSGTFDGIEDGIAKATAVGQKLENELNYSAIIDTMTSNSAVDGKITSLSLWGKNIYYDSSTINSMTCSYSVGGVQKGSENKMIINNKINAATFITDLSIDDIKKPSYPLQQPKRNTCYVMEVAYDI